MPPSQYIIGTGVFVDFFKKGIFEIYIYSSSAKALTDGPISTWDTYF